jgi:hypothetical protein
MTEPVPEAILALPEHAWIWLAPPTATHPARRRRRGRADRHAARPGHGGLAGYATETAAPGWALTFSDKHGHRFQAFATDIGIGQLAHLEAGIGHTLGSKTASGLPRTAGWAGYRPASSPSTPPGSGPARMRPDRPTQTTVLSGELARCEAKALRYWLLHLTARITRGQRRIRLRITAHCPWRNDWQQPSRPAGHTLAITPHLTEQHRPAHPRPPVYAA